MYCHSEPHVDLVQLQTIPNSRFLYDEIIRLTGAHGEEIVRSVYVDASVSSLINALQNYYLTNTSSLASYTPQVKMDM